jgi:hypothetical protein
LLGTGSTTSGAEDVHGAEEGDYLQACRRVLVSGVLARDRDEVLAVDPIRWPRGTAPLRERIAAALAPRSPDAERELLGLVCDLSPDVCDVLERTVGVEPRLSLALLQLQLDCVRIRFVFEETALRLRRDPGRFAHAEAHGRLLARLSDVKVCLRMRRWDDARALLRAYRAEVAEHEGMEGSNAGRRTGGGA